MATPTAGEAGPGLDEKVEGLAFPLGEVAGEHTKATMKRVTDYDRFIAIIVSTSYTCTCNKFLVQFINNTLYK